MARHYVYIQPNASKSEYLGDFEVDSLNYGLPGDNFVKAMKIKLTNPPVEGAANKALIKFLAKHFDLPQSKFTIIKGKKSRYKVVEISP